MALDSRGLSGLIQSQLHATRRLLVAQTSSNCFAHIGSTTNRASLGFCAPTASLSRSSDQHRDVRSRLRSAFRLSQPLDALLRPCPPGLVSCQIRSWGCDSQRVPPPSSRHGFHRALPLQRLCDLITGRSSGAAPKSGTSATPERTTPRHRSEERHLDTAPSRSPLSLRGGGRTSDPIGGHRAQGFMHLGGPFSARWCYPTVAGRASLSLCGPLRGPLPSSLGSACCRASSHGLALSDGRIQR